MSTLLLAPAGHGKTEHLIQHVRRVLADEPLAPLIVLVPNNIQAGGLRQRLAAAGGALGVEVHTFHSLYAELLTRAGRPMPLLTDPVRLRLLRTIVDDLCRQGGIRHYAALRDKPGFIAVLRNTIEELKRARILPEDFARAASDLELRLQEIARVYTAYQDWLQTHRWADNEGRGWLAAIALEENTRLAADTRLLAVSGFDEFNPTQLRVLSLLAERATETIITLTGDTAHPQRIAHRRFHRAQAAITAALHVQPTAMAAASQLAAGLAHIETHLFQAPPAAEFPGSSAASFIEAQTRSAEARAALRWIKARLVRDGLALSDVAVLARDIGPYRGFLEEAAGEFGVPLHVVSGLPLVENPAMAALLSLLGLPVDGWPRRAVVDSWNSPYTARPAGPALDEISRTAKVIGGLDQWREAFTLAKMRRPAFDPESDEQPSHPITVDIEALEAAFDSFVALLTPPLHASVRDYVAFIEAIIGDDEIASVLAVEETEANGPLHIVARARANPATAERDVAALRAFKDVLRGLVLAERVADQSAKVSYADFYADLRGAVDTAMFSLPAQAGVMVASVLDGRGLSFQAVALLGLSEGEFPKAEREDILLCERDRHALRQRGQPLETRLHGDEATFFYQAVTRARQRLLLARTYLAEDGQPWEPSPFWQAVHVLCGQPPPQRVRAEDGPAPGDAASPVEWREALRQLDADLQRGVDALLARITPQAAGPFEGDATGLARHLGERFGPAIGWSASKLESYGACPFEFFIAYALGLEVREEPEEGYDVRVLGSILHKILEDFYAGADLHSAAQAVFAAAPQEYSFRPTPLWEQQQAELLRRLEETVTALAEASSGWQPLELEAKFGMGAPSLILETDAGPVRLHGYIDRIDVSPDGTLRVIDYKAGGTAITAAHLRQGRRLQLPIYALAAQKALGLGTVTHGFYWHIQKAEASSLKLEKFEEGIHAAFAIAQAHIGRHVTGIRAGHFQPQPPAEGCPHYCPAVSFCWRYKKGF
ncbi:MAG: PD-(D/E)XK nuclease family protein [Chloroflexota bacterium]